MGFMSAFICDKDRIAVLDKFLAKSSFSKLLIINSYDGTFFKLFEKLAARVLLGLKLTMCNCLMF